MIESRLFIFGAKPGRRTYPRPSGGERLLEEFQGTFGEMVGGTVAKPEGEQEAKQG
jgi:hypothetical protein